MIYPTAQIFGFMVVATTFALLIYWGVRNPLYRLWLVPAWAWLFHGMVFYLATIWYGAQDLVVPNIIAFTDWSSIVRIQGYLAMLTYAVAILYYYRGDHRG
jgi:hypothetical protein